MTYSRKDYHYTLPAELIAQEAIHPHHNARLMVIEKSSGSLDEETTFFDLDRCIPENRVIFFNNSRVIPSRLRLHDVNYVHANGASGILRDGEIFYLGIKDGSRFEALVKPGSKFKIGTQIHAFGVIFHIEEMTESGRILRVEGRDIISILKDFGELPLPPYIDYSKSKEEDYQTVFARHDGSVAAPTASLHFTTELLDKLPHEKEYVTLHVGLGTFQGINTDDVRDYTIHSEHIEISLEIFGKIQKIHESGKAIIAVGTTVCRTLESLPYLWKHLDTDITSIMAQETQDYWNHLTEITEDKSFIHNIIFSGDSHTIHFETTIYITPGHHFQVIDELITNFHLPESSLLVLVSAFLGYTETMEIYTIAREKKYRFYSFGDGMYIRRKT